MKKFAIGALLVCSLSAPALAAPGMGEEVYGATVKAGEPEIESQFDVLSGGPDSGEGVLKLEGSFGLTESLRVGILTELEREPGDRYKAEEVAIEAIYELGNAGGIDFALYSEYAAGLNGNDDAIEAKILMQRRTGPWDLRLNLIAEKPLVRGANVELGYAASADIAVGDEVRLGLQAFGELGTFDKFAPHAEHFVGPVAKIEIEGLGPEIGLEGGYLFALGKARDDTDGQFRLALEIEF